jgi:glycosyltransferase involved in cell wall biosynthesis
MTFSVIIAAMNAASTLERAILSVVTQTCPDWEVIVQDGGSTDGTVGILKRFRGGRVAWVSEPDSGVYDAWNKALDRAGGDWTIFLGADDFLADADVLSACAAILKTLPPRIIFAYGTLAMVKNGAVSCALSRSLSAMYRQFLSDMGLPWPATFTRTEVFREQRFDSAFKIAGDFDFAARLISPSNAACLPVWVACMEEGGMSTSAEHRRTLEAERLRVLRSRIAPKARELVLALADAAEKDLAAQQ